MCQKVTKVCKELTIIILSFFLYSIWESFQKLIFFLSLIFISLSRESVVATHHPCQTCNQDFVKRGLTAGRSEHHRRGLDRIPQPPDAKEGFEAKPSAAGVLGFGDKASNYRKLGAQPPKSGDFLLFLEEINSFYALFL